MWRIGGALLSCLALFISSTKRLIHWHLSAGACSSLTLCCPFHQLSANEELCGVAAEHDALGILVHRFSAASEGESTVRG